MELGLLVKKQMQRLIKFWEDKWNRKNTKMQEEKNG